MRATVPYYRTCSASARERADTARVSAHEGVRAAADGQPLPEEGIDLRCLNGIHSIVPDRFS